MADDTTLESDPDPPPRPAGIRLEAVVLDTDDPWRLAHFYADLLGWRIGYHRDTYVMVDGDVGVSICAQLALGYRPPTWPSNERPQQFHFDVLVEDVATAGAYAVSLGAQLARTADKWGYAVYLDPAGHPFCLTRDGP